ncbi:hypothetical protein [Caudoviricetes sp.]|nr:hypothetical protein [Caudoviricetes sp.]
MAVFAPTDKTSVLDFGSVIMSASDDARNLSIGQRLREHLFLVFSQREIAAELVSRVLAQGNLSNGITQTVIGNCWFVFHRFFLALWQVFTSVDVEAQAMQRQSFGHAAHDGCIDLESIWILNGLVAVIHNGQLASHWLVEDGHSDPDHCSTVNVHEAFVAKQFNLVS